MLIILRSISCMGKTTLLSKYDQSAVVSSDRIRKELIGTYDVHPAHASFIWAEVNRRVELRLKERMITFLDATNISIKTINKYKKIAAAYDVPVKVVSIVPDLDVALSRAAMRLNGLKDGAKVPLDTVRSQFEKYKTETPKVRRVFDHSFYEGEYSDCEFFIDEMIEQHNHHVVFGDVYVFGDVHGCIDELREILSMIPSNATIYSTGDIIDRGVDSMGCCMVLMDDPRFAGFTMGNHERAFLNELDGKRCNSHARKRTHEEFQSLLDSEKERIVRFLNTGKSYLILENPDTKQRVMLSHAGIGKFDPVNMSLLQTTGDNINPVGEQNAIDGIDIQFHGHMHWNYSGSTSGTVINIDSGCCYGESLTAIDPFDTDSELKVHAYGS